VPLTDDFDHYLLIGDESALPAIGRRVEGLRGGVPVTTVVVVDGPEHVQSFETRADWSPVWAFRRGEHADDATLLRRALTGWAAPSGDGYVWIAAEAGVARRLRDHMLEDRGHPKAWLKAAGYWVRGKAGAHEKIDA
jgi:NADPH-dependent ferric siderophore reductase